MVSSLQKGKVINITQFAVFVELEEGIEGLIHVSDLSWTTVVRHPKVTVQKEENVEVRILEISREKRRISLGLKQVSDDPWPELIKKFETGKEITGEIIRILEKGIILQLEDDVEGIVPFGSGSKKNRKEVLTKFSAGDRLTGHVMEVKPDDKKVVVFIEELSGEINTGSKEDEVTEFLNKQDEPASEKIELPDELTEGSIEEKEPE